MDSTFNVHAGEITVVTTVTANSETIKKWIRSVNISYRAKRRLIFGLDIEWKPSQYRGVENPVATLQICAGHRCLIVQLIHVDYFPPSLHRFLTNPRYWFAGVGIEEDAEKLESQYGLTCGNLYDLREEALKISPERLTQWPGLKELAREVTGFHLEKPRHVTLSDWEEEVLNGYQVAYACLDAYASCSVGITLFFDYDWD